MRRTDTVMVVTPPLAGCLERAVSSHDREACQRPRPRLGVNHREVSGRLADVQRLSAPQGEG